MHPSHRQSHSFTLAIHGAGALSQRFERMFILRYPRARVFRGFHPEEGSSTSGTTPPRHPEVADIDILFTRIDGSEHVTLRSWGHHRFFNCSDHAVPTRLVQEMVSATGHLLDTVFNTPSENDEQDKDA